MNTQKKFEKYLRAAPKPPAPDGLLEKLQADISVQDIRTRRSPLRRWFAPTGRSISSWRVAAAATIAIAVLLPLSYGATKLIKRFISISQLPTITVNFPGNGGKLSPDGKHFAGITWEGELVVIDTLTGQQRNLAHRCFGPAVWSADGSEIAVMQVDESRKQAKFTVVKLKTGDTRTLSNHRGSFEDWSPDGKYLLAVRNRAKAPSYRVVMINLESNERTTLADETGVFPFPGFSPNGEWISYVTKENGRSILNLQEIDGPDHVNYSDFPGEIRQPLWSPDSSHIVFTGTQRGINREYEDLWAIRIQGSEFAGEAYPVVPDVEQIEFYNWAQNGQLAYRTGFQLGGLFTLSVDPQTGKATGAPQRVVRRSGLDSFCWSPDGKQIATRQGSEMSFISTSSGETIRSLSLSGFERVGRGISWSPDGKLIAFCGVDSEKRKGIFLIGVASGNVRLLVELEKLPPNYHPTWSPDSKTIAYGHNRNVYIVNIEDGNPKRIKVNSPEEHIIMRPVFTPDGRSVAYIERQMKDGKQIERILMTTIDGQKTREIIKRSTIDIFDLSPDGSHIVFTPGDKEIWCAPTDGGEPFKIGELSNVGDDAWAWMPKWSPKGNTISFIVTCEKYQYWVMENFLPTD